MGIYYRHIDSIFRVRILTIFIVSTLICNGLYAILGKDILYYRDFFRIFEGITNFYLLLVGVIIIIFIIGMDYTNSMEGITLVTSKGKSNSYVIKKVLLFLAIYLIAYGITVINIMSVEILDRGEVVQVLSKGEILVYSVVTQTFIIGLAMGLICFIRNIPISLTIVVFIYFILEFLWRGKVSGEYGVLAHRYYDGILTKDVEGEIKIAYFIIGIILIILSYFKMGRRSKRCMK
ncbi:MAG: hypothetical protein ACRC7N_17400 [Clostridium sp.]